jgi:hypothetical protein
MKSETGPDRTWVTATRQLLAHYELPPLRNILQDPPGKGYWKRLTRQAVLSVWENKLKEEAKSMSTLSHLAIDSCKIGKTHRVWQLEGRSILEVTKATVKAKLLVSRYPLHSSRTSGSRYGQNCPLCQAEKETITHFLLDCPVLEAERRPLLEEICSTVKDQEITGNPESMSQILLDCGDLIKDEIVAKHVEDLSRRLCFLLHHKRSVATGYGSSYSRVSRRALTRL